MSRPAMPRLPLKNGVSASAIALPPGHWPTLVEFLSEALPMLGLDAWQRRCDGGHVVAANGSPLAADMPYAQCRHLHARVYYWRHLDHERPIPFEATVVHQDEHLVIADKPHFLPVVPTGAYVQETLLVRLRRQLKLPELSPVHRLDRETAGLVAFTVHAKARHAYQSLFRQRQVHKVYEAVAHAPATQLHWPVHLRNHLHTGDHFMTMAEGPGPVNAETCIDLLQTCAHRGLALYQLKPLTGQRHQLRVHMCGLRMPILNDRIYPVLQAWVPPDEPSLSDEVRYAKPLQLLARRLCFDDPFTGQRMDFVSQRQLSEWQGCGCCNRLGEGAFQAERSAR